VPRHSPCALCSLTFVLFIYINNFVYLHRLILILRNCIKSIITTYVVLTFLKQLFSLCNFQRTFKKNYLLVNSKELTKISLSKLNRELGTINYDRYLVWRIIKFFCYEDRSLRTDSLERRWSSRRFSYGYLVTTSPQSLIPPSAAGSLRLPHGLRVLPTLMVWRAVCTRPGNVFTATCWFAITSNSGFM
jgi:hypothetical protein